MISRRTLLHLLGMGTGTMWLPSVLAAPTTPSLPRVRLEDRILDVLGGLEIGLDLRRIDPETGGTQFRIIHNETNLYPVASCFKMPLVLYYLLHTPQSDWETGEFSPAYRTAVVSDNYATAELLQITAQSINVFGNTIEKFNDFLIFAMGWNNGLHSWNWEGGAVEGQVDVRFEPSEARYVTARGNRYLMDNLVTAEELAASYDVLVNPGLLVDFEHSQAAVDETLALFSIAARNYEAPIERAFYTDYTGKDGVLPDRDSPVGRVINDAGIVQVEGGTYILAYMCAGEGEWLAIQILRQMAGFISDYEQSIR